MAANDRCSQCGNVVPHWAGTCPVCSRMEESAKRYQSQSPTPAWEKYLEPRNDPSEERQQSFDSSVKKQRRLPSSPSIGLKEQYEGINRLLCEMYGTPTRISAILRRNGVPEAEIQNLKGNMSRLTILLDKIEQSLFAQLRRTYPNLNTDVLRASFGLGTERCNTPSDVARKLGTTQRDVNHVLENYDRYLHDTENLKQFEASLLQIVSSETWPDQKG